jgi:hypothetical protein
MKLAVIMAMALATLAVADGASAAARKNGWHAQQVKLSKGAGGGSLTARKATGIKANGPAGTVSGPTTQGIIMRDGGICDPIRHMGC